jgi:Xaa-Pro aminopeptidase
LAVSKHSLIFKLKQHASKKGNKMKEYKSRRQKVFAQMEDNSIAFIPAAPEKFRSRDNLYAYNPNYDFYYLTGFLEPEAVAVLTKVNGKEKFVLFNRPHRPEEELWVGAYAGQDGAIEKYGADESYSIDKIDKLMPDFITGKDHLYYAWEREKEFDEKLSKHMQAIEHRSRMGYKAPQILHNIETIVHELRLFKTPEEIKQMRFATEVAAQAHVAAIKACAPGKFEYQLQAEFTYVAQQANCLEYSYTPIVAAGNNACTLHYITNQEKLNDGDLVLIDAGCEFHHYSSDITRTFPVNGKFTDEQKAVYEKVLAAQLAGMETLKPGTSRQAFVDTTAETITQGLVELGILKGKVSKLVEQKAYRKFYPHSPGHWIGLDTHDAGNYITNNKQRAFEPNMVTTIEPGIYIPYGTEGVDKKWWGIGVRIEDDVLITENGYDVLSKDVPKTIDDIEALMQ